MSKPLIPAFTRPSGIPNTFLAFQSYPNENTRASLPAARPVPSTMPPAAYVAKFEYPEKAPAHKALRHLPEAAGLLAVALLLHRLPARPSSFALLSSDWKDWARLALGVKAVDEINRAGGWKPPPWLLALQTVTVLAPLTHGVLNPKSWKQLPLLAITVPALVQATHAVTTWANNTLNDQQSTLPRWIPNTIIPLASTLAGITVLRGIVKTPAYQRFTGQAEAGHATSTVLGSEAVICGRCGGTHLICMSEIADMGASMWSFVRNKLFGSGPSPSKPLSLPTTQPIESLR